MGDGAMTDAASAQGNSKAGRTAFRKVWWMRFFLPLIALGAWWYFASTAVTAYHLAKEGVVVAGTVIDNDKFRREESITVRFATSEGRQIRTTIAPKTCEVKEPGDAVEVRYLPSDPYTAQDTCDPARHRTSWGAFLGALGLTALSAQAWRLWVRHRKTGQLPPEYSV